MTADADMSSCEVAIVGAGPVGLLLAGELAQLSIRVLVCDRATAPSLIPKANGVVGRAAVELARRGILAGYLVGCDGARSLVRKHAGIGFPGFTSDQIARIGRVTIPPTGSSERATASISSASVTWQRRGPISCPAGASPSPPSPRSIRRHRPICT